MEKTWKWMHTYMSYRLVFDSGEYLLDLTPFQQSDYKDHSKTCKN